MAIILKKHKEETDSLNFRIALLEKENEKLTLQNEGLMKLESRV